MGDEGVDGGWSILMRSLTVFSGLLGYAQFPGGNPLTDGVVQGMGTLSPEVGAPPYNLGTLTLLHSIWTIAF